MCWGRSLSNKEAHRLSISDSLEKRNSSRQSINSTPRSTTTRSTVNSAPMSRTGQTLHSFFSARPTGGRAPRSDPLPTEMTAKSPTKNGSNEGPSKDRKSNCRDNNDTWKSSKRTEDDQPTLRNIRESSRDTGKEPETTEQSKSDWSVMGKAPLKRAERAAARRALKQPLTTPPPPPRPSPSVPPPSIPSQPNHPPPPPPIPTVTPSPTTTPPPPRPPLPHFNPLVPPSSEVTAATNQTICTQRTLMEEETISKHHEPSPIGKKEINGAMETKKLAVNIPREEIHKVIEETKKTSVREELRLKEPLPEASTKRDIHKKSTTIEVTHMKG